MTRHTGDFDLRAETVSTEVLVERDGPIAWVTMNRPHKRNAINIALRTALVEALAQADADPRIRCLVLTGAGGTFSAGVDLTETLDRGQIKTDAPVPAEVLRSISTPVIAAVSGPCYTGGLEIALSCTFILADRSARFADTHASIGLMPGWGGSALLPESIGTQAALQMMLSGEPIDGDTAARIGLANEVLDDGQLHQRASHVAHAIADSDPSAVSTVLGMLKSGVGKSLEDRLRIENQTKASFTPRLEDVAARFGR